MAALLSDKHKVSLKTESDNDNVETYPQADRFTVDKVENKFLQDTITASTRFAWRPFVMTGGRGERRREARAITYRSDCAAAVEIQMAQRSFLCNCEKNGDSCKDCNQSSCCDSSILFAKTAGRKDE